MSYHFHHHINSTDTQYFELLYTVLNKGKVKQNRTGVKTLGVFGAQARFNLAEGFPLLTTKRVFFKGIVHELLWFLSGSTNIKYLVDNDVHIWDLNAFDRYDKTPLSELKDYETIIVDGEPKDNPNSKRRKGTLEEFIREIKTNKYNRFIEKWGNLGEGTYGSMWRRFPFWKGEYSGWADNKNNINWTEYDFQFSVDQISKVIETLKTNPDDRRMIVSAWHPYWAYECILSPCHVLFQFHTEELTKEERLKLAIKENHIDEDDNGMVVRLENGDFHSHLDGLRVSRYRLNCQLYQRSCDLFLGVPFNIASYSLLLSIVAQCVNMIPGEFIHTYGDLHLYENHLDQAREQLKREPKKLPYLHLNPSKTNVHDFRYEDISLEGYDPHPSIKAEMAV